MQRSDKSIAAKTALLCFLVALVEGYDLQSAGIAAPKLAPAYGLSPSELGWVFSSNTIGLFLGAILGGWLSDRIGRKTVLIASLLSFGAFSIGTALAVDAASLFAMRFLTGVGLGGAFPNLIALVADASDGRSKASRVTMVLAGVPLGGALACLFVASAPNMDWTFIFHVGGVAPVLLAPLIAYVLPEACRRNPGDGSLAAPRATAAADVLFSDGRMLSTLALWAASFCTLLVLYLLLNWLPTLLLAQGLARTQAIWAAFCFSGAGAAGALLLGHLIGRGPRVVILSATYGGVALGLVALSSLSGTGPALAAAALAGFFVVGAQFVLYGLSSDYYPAEMRGTGAGSAVAAGRLGAVAGPLLAGAMLGASGATAVVPVLLPIVGLAALTTLLLVVKGRTAPIPRDALRLDRRVGLTQQ